jgi:hypothetical protein
MAESTIAFNAADYDALITMMRDLLNDLDGGDQDAACTLPPPGADWFIQPAGQEWVVAANLVEAGKTFGGVLAARSEALWGELDAFFEGLCSARAIFSKVSDLAAYSAAAFSSEYPQLAGGGQ